MKSESLQWYIENRPIYKRLAGKVESILHEILDTEGVPYHMIQSRAKEIESYNKKISGDKYSDPENEIHDLCGIRIITYVEDEVDRVSEIVEKTFKIDKENSSDKSDSLGIDKVGYKSVHYVAYLKTDRLRLPENSQFKNRCFEIQIRTILQHAWAEIEHDRNYKFSGVLPNKINRRFKVLAGTLELVDREFNRIAKEIDSIQTEAKNETLKGNYNIKLNSTSFKEYFINRFPRIVSTFGVRDLASKSIITELMACGIKNIKDFDRIIPEDFENQFVQNYNFNGEVWAGAVIRMVLIIHDYKNYFENSGADWGFWSLEGAGKAIFDHYKVDWNLIETDFSVKFSK